MAASRDRGPRPRTALPLPVPNRRSPEPAALTQSRITDLDAYTSRHLAGYGVAGIHWNSMSYSWARFGVGVALGLVAFALLLVATSYIYVSLVLLFISNILTTQVPKTPNDQDAAVSSTSDLDEWRRFGREVLEGLREAIVPMFVLVSTFFIWDLAVRHYPSLTDIPRDYGELLVVMLLAAIWLVQVVGAFRSGMRRRLSSSS